MSLEDHPSLEQMAADLGLTDVSPVRPKYISDSTGSTTKIIACNPDAGTVQLADPTTGEQWGGDLAELWCDYQYDDLVFVRQRFLKADEQVVQTDLLRDARTVAESELEDMEQYGGDGSWTRQVRKTVGQLGDAIDE